MAATLIALAVSVVATGVVASFNARASVRAELAAARASGERTVDDALQQMEGSTYAPGSANTDWEINHTVQLFSSGRHLRVTRRDSAGALLAASRPLAARNLAPGWFQRLFAPDLAPVLIPIPGDLGGGTIELAVDPRNELAEVWSGFTELLLGMAVFMLVGFLLIYRTVGMALRPLAEMSNALRQIGEGDFTARLAPNRAPELAAVTAGFNAMGERLAQVEAHNRRLQEQLLTLQEEERAEIARDLHDEVGPYLFAVSIDAAAIGAMAPRGRPGAPVRERASLIQEAVRHAQSHVRDMLGRLRPVRQVEFGLSPALEDLVAFWQARAGQVVFDLDIDFPEGALGVEAREALFRLAQEALNNAMRHARPTRVAVSARLAEDMLEMSVANDGAAGPRSSGLGFGLLGMRERIEALGGELSLGADRENGWLVTARLPRQISPLEAAE